MDGYSISQVAERTGFPPSTLRFYEQSGLIRPARTPAGYRTYDDHQVELLGFVGRAKGFGLSLEEIADLLGLLEEQRCAPIQGRLRELVDAKLAESQRKIAEQVAFSAELRRVSSNLDRHTPDGPCDETCGCTTERGDEASVGVALTARPAGEEPPIVCTLSAERVDRRLTDWQELLAGATGREAIDGGVRVRFGAGVEVAALVALAAAEQECCRFFTFGIVLDGVGVAFDVTGPDGARPLIDDLVGAVP